MAQLSKLEQRYVNLSNELISIFAQGTGSCYMNMDMIQYKPGTLSKINELISRRAEINDLLEEENKEKCRK